MATYRDAAGRQRSGRIVAEKYTADGERFTLIRLSGGQVWVRAAAGDPDEHRSEYPPPSQQLSCFV